MSMAERTLGRTKTPALVDDRRGVSNTGDRLRALEKNGFVPQDTWVDLSDTDPTDTLSLYLKEIGVVPSLSKEEEQELLKRRDLGRRAAKKLESPHTKTENKKVLKAQVVDGNAACEHLFRANTRLVVSIAKKYIGLGVPTLDLIQEGNLGLLRAVQKTKRGNHKFGTYATFWIRNRVILCIANHSRTIRVPVHTGDAARKLKTAKGKVGTLLNNIEHDKAAIAIGMTPQKAQHLESLTQDILSLDEPKGKHGDILLDTAHVTDSKPDPSQIVEGTELSRDLGDVLNFLTIQEERVLRLRYGLVDGESYTLEAVGQKMGYTRERIRQIENKALKKLKIPAETKDLHDFLT